MEPDLQGSESDRIGNTRVSQPGSGWVVVVQWWVVVMWEGGGTAE